jgi:carbamoyltransferase
VSLPLWGGWGQSSVRILAFQSGLHDGSAAVFDDYRLIAAVQEERLRRVKGWGDDVPWLAIDEVLRIANWSRWDIDAIATIRGVFPLHCYRFGAVRDFYYTARKTLGRERINRDLSHICTRSGVSDPYLFFRADRFLAENGFKPDTKLHFANHHGAHAYAALFYTDWLDALIYTADGIGDNISYPFARYAKATSTCISGTTRCWRSTVRPMTVSPLLMGSPQRPAVFVCGGTKAN